MCVDRLHFKNPTLTAVPSETRCIAEQSYPLQNKFINPTAATVVQTINPSHVQVSYIYNHIYS